MPPTLMRGACCWSIWPASTNSRIGRSGIICNSCTINIVRYANAAGRVGRFDIGHLLNGLVDSYLYHSGRVDTSLPFDELRRRSLINEAAQAADDAPDFSQRIRASLPTIAR